MTMMEKLNRPALKEYAGAIAIVLGALPAITGMVISVVSSYRGEPEAQKAYSSLAEEVNKVHDWMAAINLELAQRRGREEGIAFGQQAVILTKLEALQAENDQLKKQMVPSALPPNRGEGIGLGTIGAIGHGAGTGTGSGFGSGSGRLGGSHAKPPKASAPKASLPPHLSLPPIADAQVDVPPAAPAPSPPPPTNYQEQQPLKKLPLLEKLPTRLNDL
jgi:hypothetical protein